MIKKIYILIAEIVLSDGSALVDAFVQGAESDAMTDASGFLQADVAPRSTLTLIPTEGAPCVVEVPDAPEIGEFIEADQLVCR